MKIEGPTSGNGK